MVPLFRGVAHLPQWFGLEVKRRNWTRLFLFPQSIWIKPSVITCIYTYAYNIHVHRHIYIYIYIYIYILYILYIWYLLFSFYMLYVTGRWQKEHLH